MSELLVNTMDRIQRLLITPGIVIAAFIIRAFVRHHSPSLRRSYGMMPPRPVDLIERQAPTKDDVLTHMRTIKTRYDRDALDALGKEVM